MKIFNWFKRRKEEASSNVAPLRTNAFADSAVAVAFAEAGEHETARQMMSRRQEPRQILAISNSVGLSPSLSDYSVSMAKRLNFELLVVNTTTAPLSLPTHRREEALAQFRENSKKSILELQEKARKYQVSLIHYVELGHQDEIIEKIFSKHPAMRYVLTEPDPEIAKRMDGRIDIPVFDMNCYQGAFA